MVDETQGSGGSVFAFLTGAIVGGVLGVLFAPESGEATRRRLRGYADDVGGQAREAMGRAREKGQHLAETVKEQASNITDAIRSGREAMQAERSRLGGGQAG